MIGATLSTFILAGVLSTFLFLGRSGANVQNYNEMEAQSRRALEFFAEDTRQASALSWTSNTAVNLSVNGLTVIYAYDSAAKTFSRSDGTTTRVLISGIASFEFMAYSVNGAALPLASSGDLVSASQSTKQLQISIAVARSNTTAVGATNNVLSARFILRNKRVTT
ncbi:MAG: hypothetical protein JWQ62_2422 [Lacunisphaera sp.]|nr:hypothetical protein [Lacunisphaera sp.]